VECVEVHLKNKNMTIKREKYAKNCIYDDILAKSKDRYAINEKI